MPVKSLRLKVLPHESLSNDMKEGWKILRKTIREMAYQVSRVKNRIASEYGASYMKRDLKEKINGYQIGMELIKTIAEEKKDHLIISSRIVSDAAQQVRSSFGKTAGKEILSGKRSIQNYRIDGAFHMGYDGKGDGINNTSGTFRFIDKNTIKISAFSSKRINPYAGETSLLVKVCHPKRNRGQMIVLERILNHEYKPCSATILMDGRDIFLNLCYEFEHSNTNAIYPNRIVGLDIGIKKVATCVLSDKPRIKHIVHDEIFKTLTDFRARMQNKKKEIGRAMRGYNGCRCGHGRKNKERVFDRINGSERNFQKLINNRISKAVINFAKKYGAVCIAMEDLSGIYDSGKAPQKMLRRWAYYELQEMVRIKAAACGIETIKVNPAYTTQACSFCGHTEEANVKSYKDFVCQECGKTTYNGVNAAINIAALGMEKYLVTHPELSARGPVAQVA